MPTSPKKKRFFSIGSVFNQIRSEDLVPSPSLPTTLSNNTSVNGNFVDSSSEKLSESTQLANNIEEISVPSSSYANTIKNSVFSQLHFTPPILERIERAKSPSTPWNNTDIATEEFFQDCEQSEDDFTARITNTNETTDNLTTQAHTEVPSQTQSQSSPKFTHINLSNTSSNVNTSPTTLPDISNITSHGVSDHTQIRSVSASTLLMENFQHNFVEHMPEMSEEEDSQMEDVSYVPISDSSDSNSTNEPCTSYQEPRDTNISPSETTSNSVETTTPITTTSPTTTDSPITSNSATDTTSTATTDSTNDFATLTSTKSLLDDIKTPSIRLTPVIDHSTSTPSQYFGPIERRTISNTIRIGRQADNKDDPNLSPYERPIIFKSKVVSRLHAEFFVKDNQWYVQDMRSSSGTFLNRRRLSEAGKPSKSYILQNGDILQFGMDFRGGTEEIFKCIKVRIELNHSWKRKVQPFNIEAMERLKGIANGECSNKGGQECAICLVPVMPCQPLFIAPCSHAWHYKCIRPLIVKTYPSFQCPNCRNVCDLEADAEVPEGH